MTEVDGSNSASAILRLGRERLLASSLVVIAAILLSTDSRAATLEGQVVAIADGDTLTVLDSTKHQFKVRLSGIDAPEKRQPFGQASKQNLAALVFRQEVIVYWAKIDRYGRIVGRVVVEGRDANLAQVAAGLAWHYKAHEREQSPSDRSSYSAAEMAARARRLGLWSDGAPVAPWDFRHARR